MLFKIHPERISEHKIDEIVTCLRKGGVIIYPTDTVYAIGCDVHNHKATERIKDMKETKKKKMDFSFICSDLSQLSKYAVQVDTPTYKLMRKALPGPFTFILKASKEVPKLLETKKNTIGIRVPDNTIVQAIINKLGNPLLSTSLHDDNEIADYMTDPEEIEVKFRKLVDMVVDGGAGHNVPSTVIDCTGDSPELVRQGAGHLEEFEA